MQKINNMKEYILPNYNPKLLIKNKEHIAKLYNEYGVVIFPKFFNKDKNFKNYISDLNWVFKEITSRHSSKSLPKDLGDKLSLLNKLKPLDGKIITNLGTQPNKFNSFNLLKYSPCIDAILKEIYGEQAVLVTPQAGDTLHFFPPGNEFYKYNLPPHQDYQYLMQSPAQVTFYLGLSAYKDNVGGLRIWEKSHKLGILPTTTNEFGSFEVKDSETVLKGFETIDYKWEIGDFGLFDSLLSHSSIPNQSKKHSRIVQIFRFSNIDNQQSKDYDFKSATYKRDGILFSDIHSSLLS
jgi:hypothetical protein